MDYNRAHLNFIRYLKIQKYSPATRDNYSKTLRPFHRFLEGKAIKDVRQVSRKHILEYREQIKKEKLLSSTQTVRIHVVRRFYDYLVQDGHLLFSPCEGIKMSRTVRLPTITLTPQEAEKIIQQPNLSFIIGIRDRALLELLYSTGIRAGECIKLTIFDIDIKERLLRIRGKGSKERVVPIGKQAAKWIKEYLKKARPRSNRFKPGIRTLFLSSSGNPVTQHVIWKIVRKHTKQAKIKKKGISPHTFRHTFATELLKNGADIVSIQKLLGHASLKSTMIYTKVVPVDVKQTHKKTHPRENGH